MKAIRVVTAVLFKNGIKALNMYDTYVKSIKYCEVLDGLVSHGSNLLFSHN